MSEVDEEPQGRGLIAIIGLPALLASMCCLPSVVMVLLGLSTVTSAASLSDQLYWGLDGWSWFRPTLLGASALMLLSGLIIYFRNRGICTIDDAVRNRRRVINTVIIVSLSSYLLYLLFNYVILTEIGILLGLPWESSRVWTKW